MTARKDSRTVRKKLIKYMICFAFCLVAVIVSFVVLTQTADAASSITLDLDSGEADQNSSTLDLLFMLAFLALIPSFLMMMTSFVRIVIALSFLRNAIGTQSSPPNQVIIGISIFLSIFIMFPVLSQAKQQGYDPYKAGEITIEEAITEGSKPLKTFTVKQIYEKDLDLFVSLADIFSLCNCHRTEVLCRTGFFFRNIIDIRLSIYFLGRKIYKTSSSALGIRR